MLHMPCSILTQLFPFSPFSFCDYSFPTFVVSAPYLLVYLWLPPPYATCPHVPILSLSPCISVLEWLSSLCLFLTASLCHLTRYRVTSEGIQHFSLAVLPLASHLTHHSWPLTKCCADLSQLVCWPLFWPEFMPKSALDRSLSSRSCQLSSSSVEA